MASSVFARADRRYLAQALSSSLTHGGLTLYESGLNISTQGNKDERAAAVVKHIFDDYEDSDPLILDLLNHLYVEDPAADFRMQGESYRTLDEKVLTPRGIRLTEDGYLLPSGTSASRPASNSASTPSPASPTALSSSIPGSGMQPGPDSSSAADDRVFLVHGRDMQPVQVLEQFLHFVGLKVISWADAVALTGKPQPNTYDVVQAGIKAAAAVIVVFSPDDEARLHRRLIPPGTPPEPPQGQPRQNVLLEAGMAFATVPEKTIFVRSAPIREISDISGFNWVKLDGEWSSREDLVNRLKTAKARVKPTHGNLLHNLAGPFRV